MQFGCLLKGGSERHTLPAGRLVHLERVKVLSSDIWESGQGLVLRGLGVRRLQGTVGSRNPTVYIDGLFAKCAKYLLDDASTILLKLLKVLHLGCLAKARVAGSNPVSRSNFLKHLHNTLRRFHSHCDSFVISEGERAPESALPLLNSPANDARSAAS